MKAVILAGGKGKRLRPYTYILPKPLLPLGKKPILDIIFEKLKKQGIKDIYLAVNYKENIFRTLYGDGSEIGLNITYLKESKPLGTVGPLKSIEGKVTEPFFVTNGDIISDINVKELRKFYEKTKADITVVTRKIDVPINFGVLEVKKDKIVKWIEKPKIKLEIAAGMYMLSPSVLKYIKKDEFYNMNDLVKKVIRRRGKVSRFLYEGQSLLDISAIEDYKLAIKSFKKNYKK